MTYDGKLLAQARERLEQRKADNQAEHQRRLSRVYSSIPEIQYIDQKMRAQMTELVRLTIAKGANIKDRIDLIKEENLALQQRKAQLLTSKGYSEDYLDDIYSCPVCKDTGNIGGHPCECLKKLYNMELTEEVGVLLKNGDESFENFRLDFYGTKPVPPNGVIPREAMSIVYECCKRFAESFPNVQSSLLLKGGTGLGKTYLSACVARVVAEKAYSVCYDTASTAMEAFEKRKFAKDQEEAEKAEEHVNRMLSCDLMILDDLGTELVTAVTVNALYTLINTRLIKGKPMIISTNLEPEELQKKYSPQIFSRINGEFVRLTFAGEDIRLIKKGLKNTL